MGTNLPQNCWKYDGQVEEMGNHHRHQVLQHLLQVQKAMQVPLALRDSLLDEVQALHLLLLDYRRHHQAHWRSSLRSSTLLALVAL